MTLVIVAGLSFALGALAMAAFLAYVHSDPSNIRLPW